MNPSRFRLRPCLCLCLGLLLCLPSCTHLSSVILPEPPHSEDFATLLARYPLGAGDNIRAVPLQRGANASITLVQIRDREVPHRHTRYDLMVLVVRGQGTLHLGDRTLTVKAGDVSFIPKGTPHYFVNDGPEPAASLVTFAPPFDGPDQE